MKIDPPFEETSQSNLLDKIQYAVAGFLNLFFMRQYALVIWDLIYTFAVSVIFTYALRSQWESWVAQLCFIVLMFFALNLYGAFVIMPRLIPAITRIFYGPPIFGKLGGMNKRAFYAALRLSDGVTYEFKPVDAERVKNFTKLDAELSEELIKQKYWALAQTGDQPLDEAAFEANWSEIWNNKIRKVGTKGVKHATITYGELMDNNVMGMSESLKITAMTTLIASTAKIFQMVIVLLTFNYLQTQGEILTVVRAGLFGGILLSALWFSFFARRIADMTFIDNADFLPPDMREKYGAKIRAAVQDEEVNPIRASSIKIENGYISTARDYFAILLTSQAILNTCTLILIVGVTVVIGLIFQPNFASTLDWYRHMLVGLLAIPIVLLLGYYLTFFSLLNSRAFVAAAVVGVIAFFLPYFISFALTGRVDVTQASNLTSLVTAIGASLITAFQSRVKKALEG